MPESPAWLAARARKQNTALFPVLRKTVEVVSVSGAGHGVLALFSHGHAGSHPTFLKMQHGFDPHLISIIAIFITLPPCSAVFLRYAIGIRVGRKSDHDRRLLRFPAGTPAMHFPAIIHDWPGAFLMQFMVQGARESCRLAERVVRRMRAVLPGLFTNWRPLTGVGYRDVTGPHRGKRAWWQLRVGNGDRSWRGGYFNLVVFVAFGRETRESSSPVQIATPRVGHQSSHVNIRRPGAYRRREHAFPSFHALQRTTKVNDGICL